MKSRQTLPTLNVKTEPSDFIPTNMQIDAFARRLMPEIKKFFADEQVQMEFAEWRAKQGKDSASQE